MFPHVGPWHHVGATMEITLDKNWIIVVIRQELNPVTCNKISYKYIYISQVRRDDQSGYHNLKPPSSLGSGWNEIHCPPAINRRRHQKFYVYSDVTHTHTPCLRQGGARKNEMKMRMKGE